MDEVFDSVNGTKAQPDSKPLRCAVSSKSPHIEFWNKAIKFFDSMYVVGVDKPQRRKIPSISNWVRTLRNIRSLWLDLKEKGFKFLSVRNLNQDPLENKFGGIRSYGFRDNTPTCTHFMSAYKALLLNSLVSSQSVGGNCEEDDCSLIDNLREFVTTPELSEELSSPYRDLDDIQPVEVDESIDPEQPQYGYAGTLALNYTAGYVLYKVGVNCEVCICLQHALHNNESHALIRSREYDARRRLSYPSEAFTEIFARTGDVLTELLPKNCTKSGIGKFLRASVARAVDFSNIACGTHRHVFKSNFIFLMVRLFIFSWCKKINNLLYGKQITPNPHDEVQGQARSYYLKHIRK